MSKPEELSDIASDSLEVIGKVENTAKTELNEGHKINETQFINPNSWNDHMLASYFLERNRERDDQLCSIIREPIIGRVVFYDVDRKRERTIYVSRSTPPLISGLEIVSSRAPLGSIITRNPGSIDEISLPKGRFLEFEIENKVELHPVRRNNKWDSTNNKVAIVDVGNYTIDSLIDFLQSSTTDSDDVESENLDTVWDIGDVGSLKEGFRRPLLHRMSLRDQPILDEFQDRIFRMPIDSQCFLSGAPGTGKTTTLIRRLGQKTDLIAMREYENEIRLIDSTRNETGQPHESNWIMFSPTELLRQYVKEAFNREGVAAPDGNIQTWDKFSHKIARDKLGVLRRGPRSGQFEMSEKIRLQSGDFDQTEWYDDFKRFIDSENSRELKTSAEKLQKHKNPKIKNLGIKLLPIIEEFQSGNYVSGLSALSVLQTQLKENYGNLREIVDRILIRNLNMITHDDKSFPQKLAEQLRRQKLSGKNIEERSDDEEFYDTEDELESDVGQLLDRKKVPSQFTQALKVAARAKVAGRKVSDSSQSGILLNWLRKDRLPTDEDLVLIGNTLIEQGFIRKFMRIEQLYMNSISRNYKKFRTIRAKERQWYLDESMKNTEITWPEMDILILANLRIGQQMLRFHRQENNSDKPNSKILNAINDIQAAQILVDEATDFSVIQLACMFELAHPITRSFFMCGDLNQRLTEWGVKKIDELKWIDSKIQRERIKISYRQSENLVNLAKSLAEIGGVNTVDTDLPDRVESVDCKPVWQTNLDDFDKISDWLTSRIREINSIVKETTTIGVLVNNESQVKPLAERLHERLKDISLKAVACNDGNVVGYDEDVRVFDIQHIKGLEFESIFYVSLDDTICHHPQLFPKFLYVGATRAATFLGITFKGEIPKEVQSLSSHFGENWQKIE